MKPKHQIVRLAVAGLMLAAGLSGNAASAQAPQQISKRQLKKLVKAAKSADDYLKLARYYTAEAERLDARAAFCEEAATAHRNDPAIKNLAAAGASAQYEYRAKQLRAQAKSYRELASSHEEMASNAMASR